MRKKIPARRGKNKPKGLFYFRRKLIVVYSFIFLSLAGLFVYTHKETKNSSCANSVSCIKDLSGNYDENNTGYFEGKKIFGPALANKPFNPLLTRTTVLGDTANESKHIYVDLTKQRLYAFENNNLIYDFPVSTGNPWTPTPTGDFLIWIKLRYTRMKGGEGIWAYDLPNVPYTMFFYNKSVPKSLGYGLHGAYWHDQFGIQPMSHGCVNMRPDDAGQLYTWSNPVSIANSVKATADNPGTPITIYGTTPDKK